MKISLDWLQDYFESKLPPKDEVARILTQHSFEIESVDDIDGDAVLDVKVLPDRSHDCLSYFGIAKELAAVSRGELKLKQNIYSDILQAPESNILRLEVDSNTECKRYTAVLMQGIEVKESPVWLQDALKKMGSRSINSVVDATNFVMFALGQPLHAYDAGLLNNSEGSLKLEVRCAQDQEVVETLGGDSYVLSPQDVVIADGNSKEKISMGIAGVKGGMYAEISKSTKNIVLEAANFNSVKVRQTSKRLSLRTDASVRFENEITPELTIQALQLVVKIITECSGTSNTNVEGIIDWYPRKSGLFKVGISTEEVEKILGIPMQQEEVKKVLTWRGYQFEIVNPRTVIEILTPQYIGIPYKLGASILYDAPKFFDCSSFASFLYAQAGIAIPRISVDQYVFGLPVHKEDLLPGDLIFSNSGEGRIHTNTIEWKKNTPIPEGVDHVGVYMGDNVVIHATKKGNQVVVKEKISESTAFKNIIGYRRYISNNDELRFVVTVPHERLDLRTTQDLADDIGKIFGYEHVVPKPISHDSVKTKIHTLSALSSHIRNMFLRRGFSEVITYAFRSTGQRELENPLAKDKSFLRNTLSLGLVESLELNTRNAPLLSLSEIKIFEIGTVFHSSGEYVSCAFAIQNSSKQKGINTSEIITEIKNELCKLCNHPIEFVEKNGVYEFNLTEILENIESIDMDVYHGDPLTQYKRFSIYPFVLRDIAVFIPENTNPDQIIDVVKKHAGDLLISSALFDTFSKEFEEGRKISYAYRLVFQSNEKTLTDIEVGLIMENITNDLMSQSGWQVR